MGRCYLSKFIELTALNGDKITVRPESIGMIRKPLTGESLNTAKSAISADGHLFFVKESQEEIKNLLK